MNPRYPVSYIKKNKHIFHTYDKWYDEITGTPSNHAYQVPAGFATNKGIKNGCKM